MKRILFYISIIPLLLLSALSNSCSTPNQGMNSLIMGTWKSENALRTYYFDGSGTCTLTIPLSEVGVIAKPNDWIAGTPYSVGDYVYAIHASQVYICSIAGTSGSTEPTWNSNGTTDDNNSVTWVVATNYMERGTWSIDGTKLTVAWSDGTGSTYYLSFLDSQNSILYLQPLDASLAFTISRN